MSKIKKIISLTIIVLIFACIYHIRTTNDFFMGSNAEYYRDIFDYPDTIWVCEEPEIILKVYDMEKSYHPDLEYIGYPSFAIAEIGDKEYIVFGDRGHIEIYKPNFLNSSNIMDIERVFDGMAYYKKNFIKGDVTVFCVKKIREDKIFNNKYDIINFRKQIN